MTKKGKQLKMKTKDKRTIRQMVKIRYNKVINNRKEWRWNLRHSRFKQLERLIGNRISEVMNQTMERNKTKKLYQEINT